MAGDSSASGPTFAERMMKKMGWTEGSGLGKDGSGMKDFIKPKMKFNTKGIGFMGVDNKWVAHQEHFDDLLTSLNKGEKPDQQKEIACLTSDSKLRGRTKFYSKMMRGKDLSNRSAKDLSSIIIPLSKKDKVDKPETSKLPSEIEGGNLKSSEVSMNDYFAHMMAQRKAKLAASADPNATKSSGNATDSDNSEIGQRPAFSSRGSTQPVEISDSTEAVGDIKVSKKSKKSKKRRRSSSDGTADSDKEQQELHSEAKTESKRKKKKSSEAESEPANVDSVEVVEGSEEPLPRKKDKKRKKEKVQPESVVELVEDYEQPEASPIVKDAVDEDTPTRSRKDKKNKKKKKRRHSEENDSDRSSEHIEEHRVDDSSKRSRRHDNEEPLKKSRKSKKEENSSDEVVLATNDSEDLSKKAAKKRKKSTVTSEENSLDKYSNDDTRLNVKLGLLRKIRGPSLKASEAEPVRELSDEQIQDVYRLWTSGNYSEFMRKIHAGELPRWVGIDKIRSDYISAGKGKTLDLAELRTILEKRFSTSNLHEVWGYTNLPYVAV